MTVENGNDLYAVSDHLGANEAFELLTALKGAIEDFAVRSEKLNADFRQATAREKSRRENALADQARKSAAHQAEMQASLHAARTATEAKFERRKAWINRAYQNAKDRALTNIDNQLSSRKYELQKTMLQAERDRKRNLDPITTSVQEFKARLTAEQGPRSYSGDVFGGNVRVLTRAQADDALRKYDDGTFWVRPGEPRDGTEVEDLYVRVAWTESYRDSTEDFLAFVEEFVLPLLPLETWEAAGMPAPGERFKVAQQAVRDHGPFGWDGIRFVFGFDS